MVLNRPIMSWGYRIDQVSRIGLSPEDLRINSEMSQVRKLRKIGMLYQERLATRL